MDMSYFPIMVMVVPVGRCATSTTPMMDHQTGGPPRPSRGHFSVMQGESIRCWLPNLTFFMFPLSTFFILFMQSSMISTPPWPLTIARHPAQDFARVANNSTKTIPETTLAQVWVTQRRRGRQGLTTASVRRSDPASLRALERLSSRHSERIHRVWYDTSATFLRMDFFGPNALPRTISQVD